MSNPLTANATLTEQQILTSSAYDSSSNPLGVGHGEIYFATDTKKVFLALVSGSDLTWRIVESTSAASSTGSSDMLNTNPTLWYDANTPYSVNGATEGDRINVLKDLSGNDFHAAQNLGSKQFTLGVDSGVKFFDKADIAHTTIRYRIVDTILSEVGLRIGSDLKFINGDLSFMIIFKLEYPWASGTMVDHSGGSWPSDTHSNMYEDCNSFAEKSNCAHSAADSTDNLLPFYNSAKWLYAYWSGPAAKHSGIFNSTLLSPKGGGYVQPKAGIYNNCHETWNTLFFRSSSSGKAMEILLNGRNWLALTQPMQEGTAKLGAQLGWVTTAPEVSNFSYSPALNDKWETNTETEAKTTFYKKIGTKYYLFPYVEHGYEYYPMDHKDGGQTTTPNNTMAYTGVGTSGNGFYNTSHPTEPLWNANTSSFSGTGANRAITAHNLNHALDATNAPLDLMGQKRQRMAEIAVWRRRLTDEERNNILTETHAKYAAFGGASPMPSLPNSSAAGNSGGMMPSKGNVYVAPWI